MYMKTQDQQLLEEAYEFVHEVLLSKALQFGTALSADVVGWIPITRDAIDAIIRCFERGIEERAAKDNLDAKTKENLYRYLQEFKGDLDGKSVVSVRELIRLIAKAGDPNQKLLRKK